jgi:Fe-S cluster assembly ATP-binding protein
MNTLEIKNLHVEVSGKEILKGIDLTVRQGEIHALMGPNGSGKSTLSYAIMGHPKYSITKGEILFNGKDITGMKPNERAKLGLFLSFQYPMEVAGVHLNNFLRLASQSIHGQKENKVEHIIEFRRQLKEKMEMLKMDESFASRYLNDGFSGGEKKRAEILQMAMLKPKIAILDETDSGLDIDALKAVATGINTVAGQNNIGILLITHYQRILDFITPDFVHVVVDGKIVKSGRHELVSRLEKEGYAWLKTEQLAGV